MPLSSTRIMQINIAASLSQRYRQIMDNLSVFSADGARWRDGPQRHKGRLTRKQASRVERFKTQLAEVVMVEPSYTKLI